MKTASQAAANAGLARAFADIWRAYKHEDGAIMHAEGMHNARNPSVCSDAKARERGAARRFHHTLPATASQAAANAELARAFAQDLKYMIPNEWRSDYESDRFYQVRGRK